ncbi:hypothetical protein HN446_05010 [bacterium]|nr:hypothetical protein [bacterium]
MIKSFASKIIGFAVLTFFVNSSAACSCESGCCLWMKIPLAILVISVILFFVKKGCKNCKNCK